MKFQLHFLDDYRDEITYTVDILDSNLSRGLTGEIRNDIDPPPHGKGVEKFSNGKEEKRKLEVLPENTSGMRRKRAKKEHRKLKKRLTKEANIAAARGRVPAEAFPFTIPEAALVQSVTATEESAKYD